MLPLAVAAVVASSPVFVACGTVFFSLAFWLGKVDTVARQLWELLITFSLHPEPLSGGMLRLVLITVLPAGFVGYLPARLVHDPYSVAVAMRAIGAGAYLALAALLFERGAPLCVGKPVQYVRLRTVVAERWSETCGLRSHQREAEATVCAV